MISNTNVVAIKGYELFLLERILNRQQSRDTKNHFTKEDIIKFSDRYLLGTDLIPSLEKRGLIEYKNGHAYITTLAKLSLDNKYIKERNLIFRHIVEDYDYAFLEFMNNRNEPVNILHFPQEFQDFSKIHMTAVEGKEGLVWSWLDPLYKYIEDPTAHGYILNQFGKIRYQQLKEEKEKKNSKENLEHQNMQTDNLIMVQQAVDYPKVKKERNIVTIIAVIELLVLIATLILTANKGG